MKNMKKSIALVLALVLVVGGVVGGTIAWLTDKTEEIKNTFTVGNIDITLTEEAQKQNDYQFKMIPGETLKKDPVVTVVGGSEACWLFVEITESDNLDDFITYAPAAGWTVLEENVIYREVAAAEADQNFDVLEGNEVTVNGGVTKAMMDAIEDGTATEPTLTFKAYAIQKAGFDTAAAAWTEVK